MLLWSISKLSSFQDSYVHFPVSLFIKAGPQAANGDVVSSTESDPWPPETSLIRRLTIWILPLSTWPWSAVTMYEVLPSQVSISLSIFRITSSATLALFVYSSDAPPCLCPLVSIRWFQATSFLYRNLVFDFTFLSPWDERKTAGSILSTRQIELHKIFQKRTEPRYPKRTCHGHAWESSGHKWSSQRDLVCQISQQCPQNRTSMQQKIGWIYGRKAKAMFRHNHFSHLLVKIGKFKIFSDNRG